MGTDYVKQISVRKDGVYLLQKCSDFNFPYEYEKDAALTRAYQEEGQKGLDYAFIERILAGDFLIKGTHPSVARYLPCLENGADIYHDAVDDISCACGKLLLDGDKTLTLPPNRQSKAVKAYHQFSKERMRAACERIANLAGPLTAKKAARDNGAR